MAGSITRPRHQPAPGGLLPVAPGQFEAARPWFERAVAEKEQGDVHGRVDHASLGRSLTWWATACLARAS